MAVYDPQILEMVLRRTKPKNIAKKLGLEAPYVHERIRALRGHGHDIPRFRCRAGAAATDATPAKHRIQHQITLPKQMFAALSACAEAKGIQPGDLARQILEKSILATGETDG